MDALTMVIVTLLILAIALTAVAKAFAIRAGQMTPPIQGGGYARHGNWATLCAEAEELGYAVRLVPGNHPILRKNRADGLIVYDDFRIYINSWRSREQRIEILAHELEHARNPTMATLIDMDYERERRRREDDSPELMEDAE